MDGLTALNISVKINYLGWRYNTIAVKMRFKIIYTLQRLLQSVKFTVVQYDYIKDFVDRVFIRR